MNQPKKLWKVLKSIIKSVPNNKSPYITFNGQKLTSTKLIAEEFNKYFIDSVKQINNNIPTSMTDPDIVSEDDIPSIQNEFKFKPITLNCVLKALQNMKVKK